MYYRIYPSKNNTIFKKNSGNQAERNGLINTGSSPSFEIMNGNGYSVAVMDFDISSIASILAVNPFVCNLVMWDSGTILEPALSPQDIDVIYFEEDFAEGNGFMFLGEDILQEPSNYNLRDATNNWNGILFPTAATGVLNINTGFVSGDSFLIDSITLTAGVDFAVGGSDFTTANNLIAAIIANVPSVTSTSNYALNASGNGAITITAANIGMVGNTIALAVLSSTNGHTASAPTLTGGVDIQGLFPALMLDKENEDLTINLTSFINTAITNSVNPKFGIKASNHVNASDTSTKFLYSRHTRTIFQPYLEFKINDEILDTRFNTIANSSNRFYLLTQTGNNFVGTSVTAEIQDTSGAVLFTGTVVNPKSGVYYIDYTPPMTLAKKNVYDIWKVDGEVVAKSLIQIKSPNQILLSNELNGLFFGPTTSYSHANIRHKDVVKFIITSEIRGKGAVLSDKFEYRIVASNNFEMVPWTKASIYNNRIYFNVDTNYFYPEIEYEVFVRLVEKQYTKTSSITYRFRLKQNGPTHLDGKSVSPYNNRDYLFTK